MVFWVNLIVRGNCLIFKFVVLWFLLVELMLVLCKLRINSEKFNNLVICNWLLMGYDKCEIWLDLDSLLVIFECYFIIVWWWFCSY